ncbi:MAG TPA: hypothetical protein VJP59_05960 [Gemmatimonadota bacterium]|nr:hypothetical protein [Gemmatimonadota bacterium]
MSDWVPDYRLEYPDEFRERRDRLMALSDAELIAETKAEVERQGHYYAGYTELDTYLAALIERIERLTKDA